MGGNPGFLQRNVESTVTVQSSETIVIGGLIRENKSDSETGIPFLKDMPVLGGLFRTTIGYLDAHGAHRVVDPQARCAIRARRAP